MLNWNHNTLGKSVAAAADDDVERIRTLFLDIDPVRPRFTCSTTEEHAAAKRRGNVIVDFVMKECGFPTPVYAGSSGSGATAMWKLEGADSDLVARALAALDIRFTDEVVQVDASVHNAARIARLAGTVNAKSPTPQPDRPWRRATGKVFASQPVTRKQMEALAALAPSEPRKDVLTFQPQGDGGSYNLRALLDKAGFAYKEKRRSCGIAFELRQCLTSDQHDTGASFIQMDSGAVTYTCLHNSCSGKGWKDVKHLLGIKRVQTVSRAAAGSGLFRPIKIGANGLVAS